MKNAVRTVRRRFAGADIATASLGAAASALLWWLLGAQWPAALGIGAGTGIAMSLFYRKRTLR